VRHRTGRIFETPPITQRLSISTCRPDAETQDFILAAHASEPGIMGSGCDKKPGLYQKKTRNGVSIHPAFRYVSVFPLVVLEASPPGPYSHDGLINGLFLSWTAVHSMDLNVLEHGNNASRYIRSHRLSSSTICVRPAAAAVLAN